jgi:LuxR family maltose regulon positive regulatory protein
VTKLSPPPVRPDPVVRDRVVRALASAMARPLTVLSAPAGYGKTTALVAAFEAVEMPVAWVALTAADNDDRRLCRHIASAFEPTVGLITGAHLPSPADGEDPVEALVSVITEALREGGYERIALVLDDFHVVTEPTTLAVVERVLDLLPADVAAVVASRARPALRLARRMVAGTASVIGPDVLAFQGPEVELVLDGALGRGLTSRQLAQVQDVTEGWAAGLVLADRALAASPDREAALEAFVRSDQHVRRYLEEEVLAGVGPEMLQFLRRTSILPRMNGELCAAVTQDPRAHDLLAAARDLNLFVLPTQEGGGWVRYHPQFAAVLQDQLRRKDPGVRDVLHVRAAEWLESSGRYKEAIEHASRAGDGHRAGRLMLHVETELLRTGQYTVLRRVLDALPGGLGEYEPLCVGLHAQSRLLEGAAPTTLEPVWASLQHHREAPGVARLLDHALIWPFYGRMARSMEAGRRAYETYRDESPALRHSMAAMLGFALCFDGGVSEARRLLELHIDEIAPSRSRVWALAALSFCTAKEGDWGVGVDHGREAVALVEATGGQNAVVCAVAYQGLAHALNGHGDQIAAAAAVERAFDTTVGLPGSLYHALTLVIRAKIRLAERARAPARADVAEARAIVDRFPDVAAFSATVAAVEVEAAQSGVDVSPGTVPTPAEMRLLELLPSGAPLPALAEQLFVSRNTVKTHARRLYRRLGVQNRADAVRVARDRGFL